MRLTTPCLPIREYRTIVTLNHILHELESRLLIYQVLGGGGIKDVVEPETFGVLFVVGFLDCYLGTGWVGVEDAFAATVEFFGVHGANTDHYFYCFTHGRMGRWNVENEII